MPVNNPVPVMVPVVFVTLHVPPVVASVYVVNVPAQIEDRPAIGCTPGATTLTV